MQAVGRKRGFTLIELVVVIALLGVVLAFAIPRFADLRGEARAAVMQGMLGSARSAATLAHTLSITNGNGPDAPVTMQGQSVAMSNGWPDARGILIAAQLQAGGEFSIRQRGNNMVIFQAVDVRDWTDCGFAYMRSAPPRNPTPRYLGPYVAGC